MGAGYKQLVTRADLYRMNNSSSFVEDDDQVAVYNNIGFDTTNWTITNWTSPSTYTGSAKNGSATISSGNAYTCDAEGTYMYISGTSTYAAVTLQPNETIHISVAVNNTRLGTSSSSSNIYSMGYSASQTFKLFLTTSSSGTEELASTILTNSYRLSSVTNSGTYTNTFVYKNTESTTVTRYIRIKVSTRNNSYNFRTSASSSMVTSGTLYYGWSFATTITRDLHKGVKYSDVYPLTTRQSQLILPGWKSTLSGDTLYAWYGSYSYASNAMTFNAYLRSSSGTTNLASVSRVLYYNSSTSATTGTLASHTSFGTGIARLYFQITIPSLYLKRSTIGFDPISIRNIFHISVYANHADSDSTSYLAGDGEITHERTVQTISSSSYDRYVNSATITGYVNLTEPSKAQKAQYRIDIELDHEWDM